MQTIKDRISNHSPSTQHMGGPVGAMLQRASLGAHLAGVCLNRGSSAKAGGQREYPSSTFIYPIFRTA